MSYPKVDILYLSEKDMLAAGVNNVVSCTDCMEEVVKLLDDGDYRMGGENGNSHGCMISFPDNPEFPNMPKNGPDRRFMAMPAYLGGKFGVHQRHSSPQTSSVRIVPQRFRVLV